MKEGERKAETAMTIPNDLHGIVVLSSSLPYRHRSCLLILLDDHSAMSQMSWMHFPTKTRSFEKMTVPQFAETPMIAIVKRSKQQASIARGRLAVMSARSGLVAVRHEIAAGNKSFHRHARLKRPIEDCGA